MLISPYNISPYSLPFVGGAEPFSFGNALQFDGTDDYVGFTDSQDFVFRDGAGDSPFSVGFWVNMADATACRYVTRVSGATSSWYLMTGGGDNLQFVLQDSSGNRIGRSKSGTMTAFEGIWIYIVGTYDGSSSSSGIKLYIGSAGSISRVDDGDSNLGTYSAMNDDPMPVMKMGAFDTSYANATFDEFSFWNSELSADEVTDLYNAGDFIDITSNRGNYTSSANLTSYWRFNESNPTATASVEVGAIDGTLNNFNFNASSGWVSH